MSARFLGAFRTAPDQPWISAFISDLGTEGAFLRTLVLPPPPTALELRLDWADGRPPLTCAARTVWIRPRSAAGGVVGMGIQFEDLATSEKEQLHAFVHA